MPEILNPIICGGGDAPETFINEVYNLPSFGFTEGSYQDIQMSGVIIPKSLTVGWSNSNPNYGYGPILAAWLYYEDGTYDTIFTGFDNYAGPNSRFQNTAYTGTSFKNKRASFLRVQMTGRHSGTGYGNTFWLSPYQFIYVRIAE